MVKISKTEKDNISKIIRILKKLEKEIAKQLV
jgi:hypothetical protein